MPLRSDPRVRAIVNDVVPSRDAQRASLHKCLVFPEVPHIPVVSFGVKNYEQLGKVFGVCNLPNGHKCANHKKPAKVQLSDADMEQVRVKVAELDPPAQLGGLVYFGAQTTSQRVTRSAARDGPATLSTMVDAFIYIKDGDIPITIPLLCTVVSDDFLKVYFRQPITSELLGFPLKGGSEIPFEHYDTRLGRFVPYPPVHEVRYFPRRDVLVYRRTNVLHCPGVVHLAATGRVLGARPLPSLLDHLLAQGTQSSQALSPPPSPAGSELSLPSDGLEINYSSPGRVLSSARMFSQTPSSPTTEGGSVSVGRKRKREEESVPPRKRSAKGKEPAQANAQANAQGGNAQGGNVQGGNVQGEGVAGGSRKVTWLKIDDEIMMRLT
ncbi:uncharacterized protein C8Q71DRAFT_862752 [Rhodofomes roseus]|uniref:Uncharacterized protein n=1 Tax=Rhodofomes roseus TaxID=34475 RepID=A0ABQ8K0P9_9APHY|nr:uncharacterized protein C8Q71DRAFT_862752 [Rhodofomes roseus]KAH9830170.1 hypothetical protein C8Q71DRAFT_862752 [Rhodofomes roseus]